MHFCRKTSRDVVTYRGLACRIRRACDLDSDAVIALYKEVMCSVSACVKMIPISGCVIITHIITISVFVFFSLLH